MGDLARGIIGYFDFGFEAKEFRFEEGAKEFRFVAKDGAAKELRFDNLSNADKGTSEVGFVVARMSLGFNVAFKLEAKASEREGSFKRLSKVVE